MINKSVIQIPNNIVRNSFINAIDFVLLLRLKHLHYLNRKQSEIIVDIMKLKLKIDVNDSRTIKKCFQTLYEQSYIKETVEIIRGKPLVVKLNIEKLNENPFTQLPESIMDQLPKIEHTGIRMLYYYESYIQRSNNNKQYCYTALDTIQKDLGLSRNTLIKYNELLVKNKLLKIEKHKLKTEYKYTEHDELIYDRYNNHYKVKIENI